MALVSLVLWELYGAEKVPHLFGLAGEDGSSSELGVSMGIHGYPYFPTKLGSQRVTKEFPNHVIVRR